MGITPAIPLDENDETITFTDIQGETLYTNPPSNNEPTVDHGVDEDEVWAFRTDALNQKVVNNPYSKGIFQASRLSHAPFWGEKLATPAFYKEDKYEKFQE